MNLENLPDLSAFPKIVTCTIEGILEPDDLLLLTQPLAEGEAPAPVLEDNPHDLKRLKEKHHMVARLSAAGMAQTLIATITGYTDSYISVLLNNPAMMELQAHYRAQVGNAAEVVVEKLRAASLGAVEKLAEKMEADQLDPNQLLGLAKLGLDRSGHGPTSITHINSENHVFDHAQLQAMNREALKGSREYIIRPETVRQALPSPDAESN